MWVLGLPQWLSGKESTYNVGAAVEVGLISESGRSPGGGQGNPLQYSCLENPMDGGAWWVTVHRVAKSRTGLKRLSRAQHGWVLAAHQSLHSTGKTDSGRVQTEPCVHQDPGERSNE